MAKDKFANDFAYNLWNTLLYMNYTTQENMIQYPVMDVRSRVKCVILSNMSILISEQVTGAGIDIAHFLTLCSLDPLHLG